MFIVFGEEGAGGSPFARTHHAIVKRLAVFGNITNKDLVAGNAILHRGSLKSDFFSAETPVSLGVVTTKSQLPDMAEMGFIGIMQAVCLPIACKTVKGRNG